MDERKLHERRLEARMQAENAVREYYEACNKVGYEFGEDICDVVFDATDGDVRVEVSD